MRVELPAERIEKEVESRLKRVGRTAKIKGFRPGKIPPKVVKRHYGAQIRQEVLSDLMQKSYSDAVIQEKLNPVGGPTIEPVPSENKSDFAYVATFEILPEFELKGLEKIKVERPEVEITEDDKDAMIENLRSQKATWEPVDRKSADGDRVVVDFDGTLKGEPIDGGKGTGVPVVIGQGQMLPDFEKGLTGVSTGDTPAIKVKFPKDYHAEDLQGKKIDFAITVHSVEQQVLPPLDDSLAVEFGVEEGGLEQLRVEVGENMEREARQKINNDVREQAITSILGSNPIDVPNAWVKQEAQSMQREAMQQMGIDDPSKAPSEENFWGEAERRVRLGLLLRQYIADQEITVDSDRVRSHLEEMCAGYEKADEMVASYMSNPQVIQQIEPVVIEQQALERLIANGKETTKRYGFSEYMNPPAK